MGGGVVIRVVLYEEGYDVRGTGGGGGVISLVLYEERGGGGGGGEGTW